MSAQILSPLTVENLYASCAPALKAWRSQSCDAGTAFAFLCNHAEVQCGTAYFAKDCLQRVGSMPCTPPELFALYVNKKTEKTLLKQGCTHQLYFMKARFKLYATPSQEVIASMTRFSAYKGLLSGDVIDMTAIGVTLLDLKEVMNEFLTDLRKLTGYNDPTPEIERKFDAVVAKRMGEQWITNLKTNMAVTYKQELSVFCMLGEEEWVKKTFSSAK